MVTLQGASLIVMYFHFTFATTSSPFGGKSRSGVGEFEGLVEFLGLVQAGSSKPIESGVASRGANSHICIETIETIWDIVEGGYYSSLEIILDGLFLALYKW